MKNNDQAGVHGVLVIERHSADGVLLERFEGSNLITQVGDQMYAERGAAITGAPAAPTGIKLGTGSTAVAKTGGGAALTSYLAGSNKPFDTNFPTSGLNGSSRRLTYKRTYAAGEATTASAITEAVIVNDTIGTDGTSPAANTVSRILITGISAKASTDILTATWYHDLLGS